MDFNQVTVTGRLAKDPEIRRLNNGNQVVSFSIACSEQWRDKNSGERKEKTEWISVSIFNDGLVKIAEQYVSKGSRVLIQGKLQTRKWHDQSGNDRYMTEVVLNNFDGKLILLDGNKKEDSRDDLVDRDAGDRFPLTGTRGFNRRQLELPNQFDDDIPF